MNNICHAGGATMQGEISSQCYTQPEGALPPTTECQSTAVGMATNNKRQGGESWIVPEVLTHTKGGLASVDGGVMNTNM